MKKVKIDKNIPVPITVEREKKKYPWHEMEIGDSFLVPKMSGSAVFGANSRLSPKRFGQKKVKDGIRVWRIK